MKPFLRITSLAAVLIAFAVQPSTATDPLLYGSNTGYAGAGKHPKTAVTGLIIDGRTAGLTAICYDYLIVTGDKIKGQVTVVAERISGNRTEKLATFSKNNVQGFDFSDIPPDPDGCTDAPNQPDFNFGIASDCVNLSQQLAQGDIIRWTFKFKKAPKFKGQDALAQVSGAILPFGAFPTRSALYERALRIAEGSGRMFTTSSR